MKKMENSFILILHGEFAGYQEHGPHTLIAGETGSGKGVLIQNLLLDICCNKFLLRVLALG